MKRIALSLTAILLAYCCCKGQTVLFNTSTDIYVIEDGTCNYTNLNATFLSCPSCKPFSIARFKDTLYIATYPDFGLYWMDLRSPGICTPVPNAPLDIVQNNLTCDKNGLLYGIEPGNIIFRFNPHTAQLDHLGVVPFYPSGDLAFIGTRLLIASFSGIYSVDPDDPAVAEPIVGNNGYTFFGLVTVPSTCSKNKLYGLGTLNGQVTSQLVGIDPDTRTFTGEVCDLSQYVLDAASLVEDGTTLGVSIDSVFLQSPCGTATTGSAHIFANSASKNPLSYTLDGITTNTTGIFETLPLGSHTVHIATQEGCSKDSTFTLTPGLSANFDVRSADPFNCYKIDGVIDIQASTGTLPLLFSINNGMAQTSPHFGALDAGGYHIKVIDGGHCEKDLTLTLSYRTQVTFIDHVTVNPTVCTAISGNILITPAPEITLQTVRVLLNDQPQPQFSLTGLDAGFYKLGLVHSTTCRYDTIIQVGSIRNTEPIIQATVKDPTCVPDDGSISLSINGPTGTYKTSLDNGPVTADRSYPGLAGASYMLQTMDKDGCTWDTTVDLRPFNKDNLSIAVDSVNPNCRELNSGSVSIQVDGTRPSYLLKLNDIYYANGSIIQGLNEGPLSFLIVNRDGCIVDSIKTRLRLVMTPGCDSFFIPNAFTPNGDGNNDLFRPMHSPYLMNYQLVIYNRWGQMVYSTRDNTKGWDGTRNGQPLPAGSYAWMIQYENFEGQKRSLQGVVLLIR